MPRYRAHLFGKPVAPWRATMSLAEQDVVDIGKGSRTHGGFVYLSIGVTIELDDGEAPLSPDQERWAEALAVLRMHGSKTEEFIAERMLDLSDEPAGRARWRQILDRVKIVRRAAALGAS